jgi:hypothetical protein
MIASWESGTESCVRPGASCASHRKVVRGRRATRIEDMGRIRPPKPSMQRSNKLGSHTQLTIRRSLSGTDASERMQPRSLLRGKPKADGRRRHDDSAARVLQARPKPTEPTKVGWPVVPSKLMTRNPTRVLLTPVYTVRKGGQRQQIYAPLSAADYAQVVMKVGCNHETPKIEARRKRYLAMT